MSARYWWICERCLTAALFLVALSGCRELFPYPAAAEHGDAAAPVDTRSADRGSPVDSLDPAEDRLIDAPVAIPDLTRCEKDIDCQHLGCPDCQCCNGVCTDGSVPCSGCASCVGDEICCGSECVDIMSNSQHCDGCFIDCEGGECINSQCQPVRLLEANYLSDIAMFGDKIYVAKRLSPGKVMSLSKRATAEPAVTENIASSLNEPVSLAVDKTHLCWIEQLRVACVDPNASTPSVIWEEETAATGSLLALNPDYIFWSTSDGVSFDYTISWSSKSLLEEAALLVDGLAWSGFVVDDSAAYYRGESAGQGTVVQKSLMTDTSTLITTTEGGAFAGLALHDGSLYWVNKGSGLDETIQAIELATRTISTVGTGLLSSTLLAVDDEYFYTVELGPQLKRRSRSGGFPQTIQSRALDDMILEILVDQTHLVWLVYVEGVNRKYEIWKMVK